jgi:hypothetical protein
VPTQPLLPEKDRTGGIETNRHGQKQHDREDQGKNNHGTTQVERPFLRPVTTLAPQRILRARLGHHSCRVFHAPPVPIAMKLPEKQQAVGIPESCQNCVASVSVRIRPCGGDMQTGKTAAAGKTIVLGWERRHLDIIRPLIARGRMPHTPGS